MKSVHWIKDTREIYLLRAPAPPRPIGLAYTGGGMGRPVSAPLPAEDVTVEIIGRAESQRVLDQALSGWTHRVHHADELPWVRERVGRVADNPESELGGHDKNGP